ncbi:hypothetical protein SPSIL_057950 [Sporomusa silvacetica DSM 10669]|uniref:Uncharacterized protein n=1 Tax=Sporomusa silvacetica DSM 10669 TaxID=1123289 RepID=A0ABZ3IV14_9FIRM|nr:hypothetical protein SPSIL_49840 [Sporomusa silvacetica DSM 10669]
MKKLTGLLMAFCILMSTANVACAMSQSQLENIRQNMSNELANTEEVSYYDLANNPEAYVDKTVKFTGTLIGTDDPRFMLQDGDGNRFVVNVAAFYKLNLNTEYQVSAIFRKMVITSDGKNVAVFTYEKAHLPYLSEYGL